MQPEYHMLHVVAIPFMELNHNVAALNTTMQTGKNWQQLDLFVTQSGTNANASFEIPLSHGLWMYDATVSRGASLPATCANLPSSPLTYAQWLLAGSADASQAGRNAGQTGVWNADSRDRVGHARLQDSTTAGGAETCQGLLLKLTR
eukprot:TRINITY_DN5966_c1_g2_i2.p1 TRINITY_DN5966_c1_g2~~TRINITY_DN5966_c1_g2_i2.p1  ORF type:complete len:147 (-),score=2.55 TRINITY_DN5966_c1_g2_i2:419-859(-)